MSLGSLSPWLLVAMATLHLVLSELCTDNTPTFDMEGLDNVKTFEDGNTKRYFRYFYVDKNKTNLYVGAMGFIYRLPLVNITSFDISKDKSAEMLPIPNERTKCQAKKGLNSGEFHCQNHIRSIHEEGNLLQVCGTAAYTPRVFTLYSNLTIHTNGPSESGLAKCPHDPDDNATSIYVEHGNPGNIPSIYSATVSDFTKSDPVIYRPALNHTDVMRTVKHDSKWLNEPDFVDSYDIGDYVYIFFRETAVEYINCGKAKFARVTRLCKKDRGGKNVLKDMWTTFLKARLNCSIPGEFPYYFDELQDVVIGDDRKTFYAVFTTNLNGLFGSAVCSYNLADIDDVFDAGKFKEQQTQSSNWLPSSSVLNPRPGSCQNNSQLLPDAVLTFVKGRPLMDSAVKNRLSRPHYYKRDVIFSKIAVHQTTVMNKNYTVFFLTTNVGFIHKVVSWGSQSNLVSIWRPNQTCPINNFYYQDKCLYASTDVSVRQMPIAQCGQYNLRTGTCSCCQCVRDPLCGWNNVTRQCEEYQQGLVSSIEDSDCSQCSENVANQMEISDASVMGRRIVLLHNSNGINCQWCLNNQSILLDNQSKYLKTQDYGLVVMNTSETDKGHYTCCDRCQNSGKVYERYYLNVTKTLAVATIDGYVDSFHNWTVAFKEYQVAFNNWQNKSRMCTCNSTGT